MYKCCDVCCFLCANSLNMIFHVLLNIVYIMYMYMYIHCTCMYIQCICIYLTDIDWSLLLQLNDNKQKL